VKLTINQYHLVNITTLNVRGFNDYVKQHQILDFIRIEHLDIIGLSELHVTNKSFTKHNLYTKNDLYDFYWAINDDQSDQDSASGCCLVVKKEFSKHIRSIKTYKGQMIVADFFFKRFNRIRIIHIYVLPTKQMSQRKELAKEFNRFLEDGYKNNLELIVFGDFNENMDQFLEKKSCGLETNSHVYRILNLLYHQRLTNTMEHHSTAPFPHT
jgi:exonuclease III